MRFGQGHLARSRRQEVVVGELRNCPTNLPATYICKVDDRLIAICIDAIVPSLYLRLIRIALDFIAKAGIYVGWSGFGKPRLFKLHIRSWHISPRVWEDKYREQNARGGWLVAWDLFLLVLFLFALFLWIKLGLLLLLLLAFILFSLVAHI